MMGDKNASIPSLFALLPVSMKHAHEGKGRSLLDTELTVSMGPPMHHYQEASSFVHACSLFQCIHRYAADCQHPHMHAAQYPPHLDIHDVLEHVIVAAAMEHDLASQ